MTDGSTAGGTPVPLDALPQPTARVAVDDGTPVLARTNAAFDAEFSERDPRTPVREWLADALAAGEGAVTQACTALASGERVATAVPADRGDTAATCHLRSFVLDPDRDRQYLTATVTAATAADPGPDRVAAAISHELRNPLDVARAHLTGAQERGDPEHFEQLEASLDRLERTIQDVLTLRGEGSVDPEPGVDVAAVARAAWETVDTRSATLEVGADLPTVEADPTQLRRLFYNLFRNAVEHGPAPGSLADPTADPTAGLTVRVAAAPDGDSVADDGTGIPEAERDAVFEPGYTAAEDGTGLWLAIVDRVAAAHGWTVAVGESEAGGAETRPLVDLDLRLRDGWRRVTASVADRGAMRHAVLLGRDVLADYTVDVDRRADEE